MVDDVENWVPPGLGEVTPTGAVLSLPDGGQVDLDADPAGKLAIQWAADGTIRASDEINSVGVTQPTTPARSAVPGAPRNAELPATSPGEAADG